MSLIDTCLEILRSTRDGDDLSPTDLYLVQCAVNGPLTEAGEVALQTLSVAVQNGYAKPSHFGVEHVTKDYEGYIYWRGKQLEHFSHRKAEDERIATEKLGEACMALEAAGKEITFNNYYNQLHSEHAEHAY